MRIAALDLGTNSFHLLAVEAHADGTFLPLVRDKEMLRLGDAVSRVGRVPEAEMEAAVATARRFHALADMAGCEEVVACATSAVREADNGSELVDRIEAATGTRVRVISGRDEARMIFRAVRASVLIEPGPALALDLGGGSLEVMVGDGEGLLWSASVPLGVARLSADLVRNDPPTRADRRRLRDRVTAVLAPLAEQVEDFDFQMVIGSSGTLCDLARLAALRRDGDLPVSINQLRAGRRELREAHALLWDTSTAKRRRLAGVDPRRADLLPAGSTFLTTAMEVFGFDELVVSEWALREGIVLEAIGRHDAIDWAADPRAIRQASVQALLRRCCGDEAHGRQVARLATDLFDQTLRMHRLHDADRELLGYAGLLHDVGEHVANEGHHKHSAYVVEHGGLRGFDPEEVLVLASLARAHRGSDPRPAHDPFGRLSPERQDSVVRLAALLRLADGLDRGHTGAIDGVDVERRGARVRLDVAAAGDVELELWGARRKRRLFERVFDCSLEVTGPSSSPPVHLAFSSTPT